MKDLPKSVGSIVVGMMVIIILSVAMDYILEYIGVYSSFADQLKYGFHVWWMVLIAVVYRSAFAIVGSYITASLAPHHPMRHALMLGYIGVIANILGGIMMMNHSPLWYPIFLTILSVPCAYLGGRLFKGTE